MRSTAASVDAYLAELAPERRSEIEAARALVRDNLPPGSAEVMRHGMIAWQAPLAAPGTTDTGEPPMYAALASQKRHCALYLFGLDRRPDAAETLRAGFAAAGKRLDMGVGCLRFRKAEDLALDAVAEALRSMSAAPTQG